MNREQIIERLVAVFRRYGYEGTSLAIISKETGLGRSSLYHHFPKGKEDMARSALTWALEHFDSMVLEPVRDQTKTPDMRLKIAAKGMAEFYADGSRSCLINIFSVGSAGQLFHQELSSCVIALGDIFTQVAIDSGISAAVAKQRGTQLIIEIQGALVISRTLGSNQPFTDLMDTFPQRLLSAE